MSKRQDFLDNWSLWEGTKFRYRCCERGKGTDCIRGIIHEVKQIGLIAEGYQPPALPADWIYFVPEKYPADAFHKPLIRFADPIPSSAAIPGDIVSFKASNGIECHIGIIYPDNLFLHAKPYGKVCYGKLKSYPLVYGYYRIKGLDGN